MAAAAKTNELELLLAQLRSALTTTDAALAASGLSDICRACAEVPERTCCSYAHESVEKQVDETLITINRLLGVEPATERRREGFCKYLGDHGCTLAVRPLLCVNYICDRAAALIPTRDLSELRWHEKKQLDLFGELYERLSAPTEPTKKGEP